MMRALWTGASGMNAQQTNLDTIANNFSNIATTGYKKESAQFASLLYQKIQTKTTDNEGNKKPVIGQVGLGVRNTAIINSHKALCKRVIAIGIWPLKVMVSLWLL